MKTKTLLKKINVDPDWVVHIADIKFVRTICAHNRVTVYEGYWRKYQHVCVKEIQVTDDNVDYVKREIDVLSKCIHPKVCQYLGAAVSPQNSHVYMVFEYMENGNLEDYIVQAKSNVDKRNVLMSILVGMAYLSSRTPHKIIHRDFKPTNILVNKHGEVKISDFGISKKLYCNGTMKKCMSMEVIQQETEYSHTGVGTIRWAAPEIILEDSVYDHTCDIFSFGLLAFFVVTDGVLPYFEEYQNNLAQITYAKSCNHRPFLDHPKLIAQPMMREMIKQCTERDADLRPQNANSILENFDFDVDFDHSPI